MIKSEYTGSESYCEACTNKRNCVNLWPSTVCLGANGVNDLDMSKCMKKQKQDRILATVLFEWNATKLWKNYRTFKYLFMSSSPTPSWSRKSIARTSLTDGHPAYIILSSEWQFITFQGGPLSISSFYQKILVMASWNLFWIHYLGSYSLKLHITNLSHHLHGYHLEPLWHSD